MDERMDRVKKKKLCRQSFVDSYVNSYVLYVALAIVLMLTLVACAGNEEVETQPEPAPEPEPEPVEEPVEEEELEEEQIVYPYYAPLTGVGGEEEFDHPIAAIMINNHNAARPQTGLANADIVYEVLAEGWITRFLALYQSDIPEVIGSVRSLRDYNVYIGHGYGAVFYHAGGSPGSRDALSAVGSGTVDDTKSGGFAFYRVDFARAPHNLFTGKERIAQGIERFGYGENITFPQRVYKDDSEEVTGEPAGFVDITYGSSYKVAYEYDEQAQAYIRYTSGEAQVDRETGEPVMMENVFIVSTSHRVIDDAGRREIDLAGPGQGLLLQRGQVVEVDWERQNGIITPFIDGVEAGFIPGKTWVNLIPLQPSMDGAVSRYPSKP